MNLRNLSLAALPVLAVACAPVEQATQANPTAGAPAVNVLGAPKQCLTRSQIRQTAVRSDWVIDFEMNGGDVYRSILPQRCPGLSFEEAITYETSLNQLCTTQIVYALQDYGGVLQRGAGCTLGEFVPVEYVKK